MDLEFAAIIGMIILSLILISEVTRMIAFGLIAGVLFLMLSYWVYGSGLQVNVGYNTTTNSTFNPATNQTNTLQTSTPEYAPMPATPFFDMTTLLAFVFLLCGLG